MTEVAVLQQVPLFARVPAPDLAPLADRLILRKFRAGQSVFHQGDEGTSLYVIKSGRVKIALISDEGRELLVALLQEGDFFGELSLLDSHPRSATALALTDTETYVLTREDFLTFLRRSPETALAVAGAIAERLRQADERLAENAFLDLPQRLGRCLLHLAETNGRVSPDGIILDLPLSQRELADLVGVTRQSVNKVLSQWERAGVLRRRRGSLLLLRPASLRHNPT